MIPAFYYQNRYFLFPEGCPDAETLLSRFLFREIKVQELVEHKCMAPYFVRENLREAVLRLPLDARVYPVEVELLTMKEYNARLRALVEKRCPGCPNFGELDETDESLEGHHEEVALNDVCFFRQACVQRDNDDYNPVDLWMQACVEEFGSVRREAEQCIDRQDWEQAWQIVGRCLVDYVSYHIPVLFFGKREGKYEMYSCTMYNSVDGSLYRILFERLQDAYGAEWNFIPYIPRGYYSDRAKEPESLLFRVNEGGQGSISLSVYGAGAESDFYFWLCGRLGEDRLQWACQEYEAVNLAEGGTLPEEWNSVEELEEALDLVLADLPEAQLERVPVRILTLVPESEEEELTPEELMQAAYVCNTVSVPFMNRFYLPLFFGYRPGNIWEEENTLAECKLPIARLVFRDIPAETARDFFTREETVRAADAVGEMYGYLRKAGLFCTLGVIMGANSLEYVGFTLNHAAFLYALRRMAPFFEEFPADLYLYTASGKSGGQYALDFGMELVKPEKALLEGLPEVPKENDR